MKFKTVNHSNINTLYKLNKHLAKEEGQLSLFTAKRKKYKDYFLCNNPMVFGILIFEKNKPIGFIIYVHKFATYLASKVLFIEDIYLKSNYQNENHINSVLQHIIKKSKKEKYARIELRVLKNYSLDKKLLKTNKFKKIKKWDTYRYEKK